MYEPEFGGVEADHVEDVMRTGMLTAGPEVAKFDKRFAKYINAPYVVAVNSCSSAMFLSLMYWKIHCDIRIGNKVFIPSVTHASVANSVVGAGFNVEFVDEVFVGQAYDLVGAGTVDSAHELYRNCFDDMDSPMFCYSFYPTKPLGGAEGGAIATDDKDAYQWLKRASRLGIEPGEHSWDYKVMFPGWKMHMNDVQAVILTHRLGMLKKYNDKREKLRDKYNEAFGLDNQSLHVYPVFVEDQKEFIKCMANKQIECSVHFKPLHLQPAFKSDQKLPKSEWWGEHEVSLPLHENLGYDDVERIIKATKSHGSLISEL